MKLTRLPLGPKLDAAICREVFGVPEEKVRRLAERRRLPRYSRDYGQAAKVHEHFCSLASRGEEPKKVARYRAALDYMTGDPVQGLLSVIRVGSCPCNVCDAALFAVRGQEADQVHGALVEYGTSAERLDKIASP